VGFPEAVKNGIAVKSVKRDELALAASKRRHCNSNVQSNNRSAEAMSTG